jgi:hypothetical protein
MIKFWFRAHLRLWDSDGQDSLVTIDAPTVDEAPKTKDFNGEEAVQRLSELSVITDSGGWATSGFTGQNSNLNEDFIADTSNAHDVLDQNDTLSRTIDGKLSIHEQQTREETLRHLQEEAQRAAEQSTPPTYEPSVAQNTPFYDAQPTNVSPSASPAPQAQASQMQPEIPQPIYQAPEPAQQPEQSIYEPYIPPIEPPVREVEIPPVYEAPIRPKPAEEFVTMEHRPILPQESMSLRDPEPVELPTVEPPSENSSSISSEPVIMESDNVNPTDIELGRDDDNEVEVKLH